MPRAPRPKWRHPRPGAVRGARPVGPRRCSPAGRFSLPHPSRGRCGGGPRRLRPCEALTLRCFFPGLRWRREGSRAEGAPVRGRAPRGGWCPTLWDGEGGVREAGASRAGGVLRVPSDRGVRGGGLLHPEPGVSRTPRGGGL